MNKQEKIAEIISITNPASTVAAVVKSAYGVMLRDEPRGSEVFDNAVRDNASFLESSMATAYESFFTEEEIDAMHAYYSSSAGRSAVNKGEELGKTLHAAGEEWGNKLYEYITKELGI